jgi:DNA-binding Lrp family transcriptional regulator
MSRRHAIELSDDEASIIAKLQRGESQKEIAADLGKDETTISKKIRDLKEKGIIVAHPSVHVDPSKLVKHIIYGLIKLRKEKGGRDWADMATGFKYISSKIIEAGTLFGQEWDILIKCYVNDLDEYYDEIVRKIQENYEIIGMTSFILFHPIKFDYRVPKECMNIKKL